MKVLKFRFINFIASMKIRHKILLLNLLILLIPCIFFAMKSIKYYQEIQIQEQVGNVESDLIEITSQFMNSYEICNMTMQTMLLNNEVEKFIGRLLDGDNLSVHQLIDFNNTEIRAIERLINTNPYIHSIRFYINSKILELAPVIYTSDRFNKVELLHDFKEINLYFDERDTVTPSQKASPYAEPLVTLVAPCQNIKREQIGVVEIATPMRCMFPQMYTTTEQEVMYFIDENKNIYQDDYVQIDKWKLYQDDILKVLDTDKKINLVTLGQEPVVIGYKPIKNINGYIVKIRSLEEVYQQISWLRMVVIFGMISLIAIITFLINKSTQLVFKNFYKILNAIHEVQKGNLDVEIEEFGNGEMGELGRSIQTMTHSIKELMNDKITQETLVKDSQIKALQNQINAHFIYNVLESIKMMAEIEGMFEMSDAITYLGKLLRYSMKWRSPMVKLKEELDYIENYMALLNLRYDYKITTHINIPDDLYEQMIPKMCIQPIVENAMKHGIEDVAEDTAIYIKGKMEKEYFIIEVMDFGTGMDKVELNRLKMKIAGELVEEKQSSNGIGLKNVQDRIKLCFGEGYGLEVQSKEGSFTKIVLKIPYSV